MKQLEKEYQKKVQGNEDLEMEKRGKEREVKNESKLVKVNNDYELELESDLREKQDELDRLKSMIKEKQLSKPLDTDNDYERISKEISSIKILLMDLKSQPSQPSHHPDFRRRPIPTLDYSISEIKALLDLDLPKAKHKREKYENDRVLMRQLLSNIERNRVKLRKEYFEADTLSNQRKLAIQGLKEKVDDQARILQEEEQALKDKCDYYRRKEDKLRVIKSKVNMYE